MKKRADLGLSDEMLRGGGGSSEEIAPVTFPSDKTRGGGALTARF